MNSFNGFSKEFTDFLFTLQFRNTMELLPENKEDYKKFISNPLTLLFYSLIPTALSVSDTLVTKPSKCVSSMYTHMRFSRATPLKEYMYIRFREPSRNDNILGLYFDMGYQHYSYGIRIYKQTSAGMEQIRESILKNKRLFTKELSGLNSLDMTIRGDKYVKDRYPGENCELLKELLNSRNFYIGRDCPIGESVFNGAIKDEIAGAYVGLKDVYSLLKKALYGN